MPVTTLDPKSALIVVDLQKGIVALPSVHPIAGVIANASALATSFRRHGLPVVLVNVAGGAPGRPSGRLCGAPCRRTGRTSFPS